MGGEPRSYCGDSVKTDVLFVLSHPDLYCLVDLQRCLNSFLKTISENSSIRRWMGAFVNSQLRRLKRSASLIRREPLSSRSCRVFWHISHPKRELILVRRTPEDRGCESEPATWKSCLALLGQFLRWVVKSEPLASGWLLVDVLMTSFRFGLLQDLSEVNLLVLLCHRFCLFTPLRMIVSRPAFGLAVAWCTLLFNVGIYLCSCMLPIFTRVPMLALKGMWLTLAFWWQWLPFLRACMGLLC